MKQCKYSLTLTQLLVKKTDQLNQSVITEETILSGILIILNRYTGEEEIEVQVFGEEAYSLKITITQEMTCEQLWQALKHKQLQDEVVKPSYKITFMSLEEIVIETLIATPVLCKVEQLILILQQMIENPSIQIADLNLLTQADEMLILKEFNHNTYPSSKYEVVIPWFENVVSQYGEQLAAICNDETITYKFLNEKANQVGWLLRKRGIGPKDYVGVITGRGMDMLIGIMGVLKAGATYVPIDPQYPEERINYILTDCGAKCIVGNSYLDELQGNWEKVYLTDLKESTVNLENLNHPEDIAYVIYTSGTTGKPKGVMITHSNLCHIIEAYQKWYDVTYQDVILQFASMSFDQSVWDIFGTLLSGATSCLVTEHLLVHLEQLEEYIQSKGVTFVGLTPTVINELNPERLPQLRVLESGGEKAQLDVLKKWQKYCRVFNTYGPTECTINALSYEYKGEEKLPIGKPIGDVQVYILDKKERLMPIGIPGELCIAGKGVAKGYLNRQALTDEKFIDNPFGSGKLYKTGDLAKWLPDGNVDYLGRMDEQVKIRGLRIELGEIEMVLRKQPYIQEAVVMVAQNNFGESYLCAFFVASREIELTALKNALKVDLPNYMVPHCMLQIPSMPRTTNGKVDKRKLPKLELEVVYEAPTNEIEEKLCELFSSILNIPRVGIQDDFFALGGHSLRATKLINEIASIYHIQLAIRQLFENPTVKAMSKLIKNGQTTYFESLEKAEVQEDYPISAAQKGMYILTCLAPESVNYNMAEAFYIEGALDVKRLENAFQTIIKRHSALRTSFIRKGEEIVQKVAEKVDFKLEFEWTTQEELAHQLLNFIQPFDLTKAPLIRGKVYAFKENQYVLAMDLHHIVGDGSSYSIIIEELSQIYNKVPLKEVAFQYVDYTKWQQEAAYQEDLKAQEAYWLQCFKEEIPSLEMPIDKVRPFKQSFEGDSFYFKLPEELYKTLQTLCGKLHVTLNMLMLASYSVVLQKYSGQEALVIGMPIAGRDQLALQEIVGMFVNTLPIYLKPEGKKSFKAYLEEVKECLLKGYENEEYPFSSLIEKLHLAKDASHNPLFDVAFVFQNTEEEVLDLKGTRTKAYPIGNKAARFDLTLVAQPVRDGIDFEMNYCTKLYHLDTIKHLSSSFICILESISKDANQLIEEIEAIDLKEKTAILGFNGEEKIYETAPLLHELFEQQVSLTPHQIAIKLEETTITYEMLNEKADALAYKLQLNGIGAGCIVGLFTEITIERLIGVLAILKAGGAYLPIDPMYPTERIAYILENSKVTVLLTQRKLEAQTMFNGCKIYLDDQEVYELRGKLKQETTPEDLAYVIYTSGSTGKPKGVMVAHKNIVNTLLWRKEEYQLTTEDKVLQNFSVAFDGFVTSFFTPIISGATAIFVGLDKEKDAGYLAKTIIKEKITHLIMVPILYKAILLSGHLRADNQKLKVVCVAGDKLDGETVKLSEEIVPDVELANEYGPTENAVASSILRKVTSHRSITIGHPITNCYVYIVDKNLKLVPIGVKGEICLGGKGVTKGYLNRPELTAERFEANPYRQGEQLYHTGDLGRWLPNGEIDFIRRMDDQVQVRGYRVELGEIENVLLTLEGIKECVVLAQNQEANTQLYAYYMAQEEIPKTKIRKALREKLPYYMVPTYFIYMKEMPITPNGKIDRKALLSIEIATDYEENEQLNSMENQLLPLCLQAFKVTQLRKGENFFDIGADSLKLIELQALLLKEGLEISIAILYEKCSLEELASFIEEHRQEFIYKVGEEQQEEMSNQGVTLPTVLQRKMTTYLHRSLPMCILMAYEAYWPWYYSNFTQIYAYENAAGYVELNYLEPFDGYIDVAEVICFGYPLLQNVNAIVTYIKENINRGYYVVAHFDEYYLPNKWAYQKQHFIHSSLIYGYDESLQKVYLISFDEQMTFTKLSYEMPLLEKAYIEGEKYYKESAPWCEWSAVQLIKPRTPERVFPFSLTRFKNKLEGYLQGKDEGYITYTLELDPKGMTYGKNVYQVVIGCLEKVLKNEICIDYRAIHLLYEHKVGLLERFNYIAVHYKVPEDFKEQLTLYEELIGQCNVMRLKFKAMQELEGIVTDKQKETIQETIIKLKQIAQRENSLLHRLYDAIKGLE